MTLNLNWKHALAVIVLLFLYGFFHTSYRPYLNNQWKSHRWNSQSCLDMGKPAIDCSLQVRSPGTTETGYFDFCMEHGEWRRIK